MRNFWAVYTKELKTYFVSPIAYTVAGVFIFLSGYFFNNLLKEFSRICFTYTQQMSRMGGQIPLLNLNEWVVTPFFGVMDFIWLLMIPMLTMRLYSEEKKAGTMELLMTSPITTVQVLLGKFFACFTLYLAIVATTIAFPILLEIYAEPDWGPILSAYAGVILMGSTFIAIGVFMSSLTENQIVAVIATFGFILLFWLLDWSASFAGPTLGEVLRYLSIMQHLADFHKGVIDTNDVVYYISFIAFALFLTYSVIESRRWRSGV